MRPTPEGVVLINLGTPDAPTTSAVRRYLAEFLNDPRVIDLGALPRWLLLNLIILPFRPSRSAHAYQQVWTEAGSPLLVNARAQRDALQALLPEAKVALGMRYGSPSLADALAELRTAGVHSITVVPMYPQWSDATTGSSLAAWESLVEGSRVVPSFHGSAGYIEAAAQRVRESAGNAERVLFSYHGLPLRQVRKFCARRCVGDCPSGEGFISKCYRAQCFATTQAVSARAGVAERATTTFQSRIKGTAWMAPFTDEVLASLPGKGIRSVAVAPLSFVADCLETLEEIGIRGRATFLGAGGEAYTLVPAVNADARFMTGLASLVRSQWET